MDIGERVRMAGALVDFLKSLGCAENDIVAIADAIRKHIAVQESHASLPTGVAVVSSLPSRN
jgi:hypothetical protein